MGSVRGGHPPSGPRPRFQKQQQIADAAPASRVRYQSDTAQRVMVSVVGYGQLPQKLRRNPVIVIPAGRKRPRPELTDLQVVNVDLRDRMVYSAGRASRRSGPWHRAVPSR